MLTKKRIQQLKNDGYDLDFIQRVKPQGGITHKNNFYTQTGDGYTTCLHVYNLPTQVPPFWLMNLTDNLNTITKIDIATANKEKVLSSINRTLSEYKDRSENERTYTNRNDALDEFINLQDFASRVTQGGEVVKLIHIRIFISDSSLEALESRKKEIVDNLGNYKATTYLFDEKEEWLSLFESSEEQEKHFCSKEGIAVPATAIGGGYPFNHQYLIDSRGGYIGQTDTGGAFIFDPFNVTENRTSFSGIGVGLPGYGKSTLLKTIEEYLVGRQTIIRGFEKNGDWYKLIESQNGKIVDLSGANNQMINPLEVLATKTDKSGLFLDELGSYMQHKAKLLNQIRFLNPKMGEVDSLMFGGIIDSFYIAHRLLPHNYLLNRDTIHITGLPSTQYPTMREFRDFYYEFITRKEYKTGTTEKKRALEEFGIVLDAMVNDYGALYNGHTTFDDFSKEQIVFFDIDGISSLDKKVFNSQLFTAMTMNWNQAMLNGRKMKTLLENREITADEVTFFMNFMDECQNILNIHNFFAVDYVVDFLKEMRKFSAGTYLMTQSPQELLPESSDSIYISKIKQVFELCPTKMFLHLDDSVVGRLKEVLGTGFKDSDYQTMRELKKTQVLFSFGSGQTYKVNVDPTEEQLERFAGGH
ncbi:VirB4 family type IV secretion system protein [Enterococcus sp. AZ163]|uniref:VirB4 family type IV secretion system protein n=1 Tax=Enterococcus sp. AZ163 TaxID=2774638 RepID=UPI003D279DFC